MKRPLLLEKFLDNNLLQFFGYEAFFFVEKYDKNWQKLKLRFFFAVFRFDLFFRHAP